MIGFFYHIMVRINRKKEIKVSSSLMGQADFGKKSIIPREDSESAALAMLSVMTSGIQASIRTDLKI